MRHSSLTSSITKLNEKPKYNFKLLKFIKNDGKDNEREICINEKDGTLGFSKKDRKRI